MSEKDFLWLEAILRQDKKEIRRLVREKVVDVNHQFPDEWTGLMVAILNGFVGIVKLLIQLGADVNIHLRCNQSKENNSALCQAIINDEIKIVEILLEKTDPVYLRDENLMSLGKNLLEKTHPDIRKMILDKRANP